MKSKNEETRDLEKEREDILKLAELKMPPELRKALIQAQAIPYEQPTQEIKTSFERTSYADTK